MEKTRMRNGIISLVLLIMVVWIMVIGLIHGARVNARSVNNAAAAPVASGAVVTMSDAQTME